MRKFPFVILNFLLFIICLFLGCSKIEKEVHCLSITSFTLDESIDSPQGMAYYDDGKDGFIIRCSNNLASVLIYDGKTGSILSRITPNLGLTVHCNTVSFGTQKVDADDKFPLLYCPSEADNIRAVYVLRISDDMNHLDLVQTIHLPNFSILPIHWANAAVDSDHNRLVISGYYSSQHDAYGDNIYPDDKIGVFVSSLPDVCHEEVYLGSTDICDYFEIPAITTTQGWQVYHGKIYQVFGMGPSRPIDPAIRLGVINLKTHGIERLVTLSDYGLTTEPEGLFVKDGKIFIDFFGDELKVITANSWINIPLVTDLDVPYIAQ